MKPTGRDLVRLAEAAAALRGPVADGLARMARWNQPTARLVRQIRRAERMRTTWLIAGVLAVIAAVVSVLTVATAVDIVMVVVLGVGALAAGRQAYVANARATELRGRLELERRREVPAVALPGRQSLAREPMRRLADAELTLTELLHQLRGTGRVPSDSLDAAADTGTRMAAELRAGAARLQAIEQAREHAPPLQRGPLADGVRTLRAQLDDGVDGYGALVAAAGRVLMESGPGDTFAATELADATDRLAGLAAALRELPRG